MLLARCGNVGLGQGAAVKRDPCGLCPPHLVEDFNLHTFQLDILAFAALALSPNATTLSRELLEGAGSPPTPLHGSAHGSILPRKDVDKMGR